MKRLVFFLAFILPNAVYSQTVQHLTETAKPADSFVDSIGVNVHMTYGNTAYGDVAAVKKMLSKMCIRDRFITMFVAFRRLRSWQCGEAYGRKNRDGALNIRKHRRVTLLTKSDVRYVCLLYTSRCV